MHVSAETDEAGNPSAMWHRVGNCFAVGRLGLQGFIGTAAKVSSSRHLDRGGLNRLSLSRFGLMWLWFPVPGPRLPGLLSGLWFPFLNIKMGPYLSGMSWS